MAWVHAQVGYSIHLLNKSNVLFLNKMNENWMNDIISGGNERQTVRKWAWGRLVLVAASQPACSGAGDEGSQGSRLRVRSADSFPYPWVVLCVCLVSDRALSGLVWFAFSIMSAQFNERLLCGHDFIETTTVQIRVIPISFLMTFSFLQVCTRFAVETNLSWSPTG